MPGKERRLARGTATRETPKTSTKMLAVELIQECGVSKDEEAPALVRPDGYVSTSTTLDDGASIMEWMDGSTVNELH